MRCRTDSLRRGSTSGRQAKWASRATQRWMPMCECASACAHNELHMRGGHIRRSNTHSILRCGQSVPTEAGGQNKRRTLQNHVFSSSAAGPSLSVFDRLRAPPARERLPNSWSAAGCITSERLWLTACLLPMAPIMPTGSGATRPQTVADSYVSDMWSVAEVFLNFGFLENVSRNVEQSVESSRTTSIQDALLE